MNKTLPLSIIFSTGRSGSTFLGAIFASHRSTAYRFEPFHRLRTREARNIFDELNSETWRDGIVEDVYRLFLPAIPEIDIPPYFDKDYLSSPPVLRGLCWPFARISKAAGALYTKCFSPTDRATPLILKEVTHSQIFRKLVKEGGVRAIYLVRHPATYVWSNVRGQRMGVMPTGRHKVLPNLLQKHSEVLHRRYVHELDGMDDLQKEALLWRIDVEGALEGILSAANLKIVLYEDLSRDPLWVAQDVFPHFGLAVGQETKEYLERSANPSLRNKIRYGDFRSKEYFTTFRARNALATSAPKEVMDRVMPLVEQSWVYQYCRDRGRGSW